MLRILRKINLFLILLIVFLVPVVFCPCLFNAFSLPKIALFRSLVLLLLFFSVFKFFLIDKKFSSPRQSAYLPRSSANKRILNFFIIDRKLLIFLVLLSLGVLISTVFSANFLSSFWGSSSRHLGLYTYLNFFLFFLLLLQNIKNWSEIKKIIWVILFSSFLVSVYAWLQYYGLDPFTWSEGPGLTGRAFGSLGQPNFLAHFLAINIPLSLYAFFYLARGKWTKVVCALVFLAQFGALLATLSRSAWLALLAGAVFALLFYLFIRKKFRILCTTTGALLIGLVLIVSSGYFLGPVNQQGVVDKDDFQTRIAGLVDFKKGSGKMRLEYWQASWEDFTKASLKIKLIGHGPDNLKNVLARFYERDWGVHETVNTYPDRAHNLFFDTLLQFGILGVILFLLFFGYIFYRSFRFLLKESNWIRETRGLVFTLFVSGLIYILNNLLSFSSASTYVYFYLFLALICLIVFRPEGEEGEIYEINFSPVSKYLILGFLGVFILTTIFFHNLNLVRADYAYARGLRQAQSGEGDCLWVLNSLNKANKLGLNNTFYKREFLRYSLNCYPVFRKINRAKIWQEEALETIKSVSEKQRDYLFKMYEGRIYSLLSQENPVYYAQAQDLYKELLEFNPYLTDPYKELGRLYLQEGETDKARKYLNKGVERLPSPNNKYLNTEHRRELKKEIESFKKLLEFAGQ